MNSVGSSGAVRSKLARAAEVAATSTTKRRLRILAYHGIDDPDGFARHVAHVRRFYAPVTARDVVDAFTGRAPLPDRAVWFTFDDGLPSVVEAGLPILRDAGVPATLFVCPGLIESGRPHWWHIVETASEHGIEVVPGNAELPSPEATRMLKNLPDDDRRAIVSAAADSLAERGIAVPHRQLRPAELVDWQEAGNDLGNHSWDHPCLDRCSLEEQRRQVLLADAWLKYQQPGTPAVFAYPNGNATLGVEDTLRDLDYALAFLFDHRLASTTQPPLRVSRFRVSSTASPERFAVIASGVHSAAFHLHRKLSPRPEIDTAARTVRSEVDDRNHSVYRTPGAVEQFTQLQGLMNCETHLFGAFVPADAVVLDLGVGAGRTVPWLQERSSQYIGVDYSPEMVQACRLEHPGVDARLLDAADLSEFESDQFDTVVFSYNGLDYLHPRAKREECIAEIARVCRSGGTVIVSSHNSRAVVRPRPPIGARSEVHARAVQAFTSIRLARFTLVSASFWKGAGYVRDPASEHINFATTRSRMSAAFEAHGFRLLDRVGSQYPTRLSPIQEPWYYYAFRLIAKAS